MYKVCVCVYKCVHECACVCALIGVYVCVSVCLFICLDIIFKGNQIFPFLYTYLTWKTESEIVYIYVSFENLSLYVRLFLIF